MQPSDSLTSFGASSGLPLLGAYLGANAVLRHGASRARVRRDAAVGDGSPGLRRTGFPSRRREGLPGLWTVLLLRAVVEHPAGYAPRSPNFTHVAPSPSSNPTPSAPEMTRFRGCSPTAHMLAYLRIAPSVTVRGARLATSWAGYSFAGRVSHPPDS